MSSLFYINLSSITSLYGGSSRIAPRILTCIWVVESCEQSAVRTGCSSPVMSLSPPPLPKYPFQ